MIDSILVLFVIAVEHALEISPGPGTDGAEIYVYKHEDGDHKPNNNMQNIGKMYATVPKNIVQKIFRIQEHQSSDDNKWY